MERTRIECDEGTLERFERGGVDTGLESVEVPVEQLLAGSAEVESTDEIDESVESTRGAAGYL